MGLPWPWQVGKTTVCKELYEGAILVCRYTSSPVPRLASVEAADTRIGVPKPQKAFVDSCRRAGYAAAASRHSAEHTRRPLPLLHRSSVAAQT